MKIATLFTCIALSTAKSIPTSQRVVNEKLKVEDQGDGWHEWHHAFNLADEDGNGKLTSSDIPSLYREHFNKIMATQATHEMHEGNPELVVREETDVFLEDAGNFQRYVSRQGTKDVKEFDWNDFKIMMQNYWHVQADLLNARREL